MRVCVCYSRRRNCIPCACVMLLIFILYAHIILTTVFLLCTPCCTSTREQKNSNRVLCKNFFIFEKHQFRLFKFGFFTARPNHILYTMSCYMYHAWCILVSFIEISSRNKIFWIAPTSTCKTGTRRRREVVSRIIHPPVTSR